MRSQRFTHNVLFATAAAGALLLTGCGGAGQPQTQEPSTSSMSPNGSSPSPGATTASAPASTAPASAPVTGTGRCTAETLTASIDSAGGGAAGSVYMTLVLTNSGPAPCLLTGFPGVSLTAGPEGGPIGAPAVRDESKEPVELMLAPGESGGAELRYVQAGMYPDCVAADAAGYRIYPPEDFGSLFIPQPTSACSDTKTQLLTIGAFQPA